MVANLVGRAVRGFHENSSESNDLLRVCDSSLRGRDEYGGLLRGRPRFREAGRRFLGGQGGYHTYRVPSVIVTKKGTLLAFCEARKHHRSDDGDIDLVVRRSFDGSNTWEPMRIVWDDGDNTCGNACPVVDENSGTIWLAMTWNRSEDTEDLIIAGESKHPRRPYLCYSNDDGRTWSSPADLSETCRNPEWGWYATGPGVAIQLKRGKNKGRLVVPASHSSRVYTEVIDIFGRKVNAGYGSHVIYSDDRGKTWRRSQPIRPGCNES